MTPKKLEPNKSGAVGSKAQKNAEGPESGPKAANVPESRFLQCQLAEDVATGELVVACDPTEDVGKLAAASLNRGLRFRRKEPSSKAEA